MAEPHVEAKPERSGGYFANGTVRIVILSGFLSDLGQHDPRSRPVLVSLPAVDNG